MTATATPPVRAAHASYVRLAAAYPPHPIADRDDYAAAARAIDPLAARDEGTLDAGEQMYLDAVTAFIAAYDDAQPPIPTGE